jgi:hypothetical protein
MKIIPGQQWGEGEAITGTGLNAQTQENINIINGGLQHTELPDQSIDYTAVSMNPMSKYYTLVDSTTDQTFTQNDMLAGKASVASGTLTGVKEGFLRGSLTLVVDNIGAWTTPNGNEANQLKNYYNIELYIAGRKVADTNYIGKGYNTTTIPFFTPIVSGSPVFNVIIKPHGFRWAGQDTSFFTVKSAYAWARNIYR